MSLESNNLLKTIKSTESKAEPTTRLATVISGNTTSGFILQFYGEEEPTQKAYKMAYGLSMRTGITVILTKINGTYLITGRL